MNDPVHVRLLKDIAIQYEQYGKTVILLSHAHEIPAEISHYCATAGLSLPGRDKIESIVREIAASWSRENAGQRVKAKKSILDKLISNLAGLTVAEVRRLVKRVIYQV